MKVLEIRNIGMNKKHGGVIVKMKSNLKGLWKHLNPVLLFLFLLLFAPPNAGAVDKMCFPNGYGNPPAIDGIIDSDPSWIRASQYTFDSGAQDPFGIIQTNKSVIYQRSNFIPTSLYVSFEIKKDPSFDETDVIVIGIAPDDSVPADHRRIHIFPVFKDVGANGDGRPSKIEYWKGSGTWNETGRTQDTKPAWLDDPNNIKVTSVDGALKSYNVEVKIPISKDDYNAGINLPTDGTEFGLYFNTIRVNTTVSPAGVVEWDWPESATNYGSTATVFLNEATPPVSEWGRGVLANSACLGVKAVNQYTNHSDSSAIFLNSTTPTTLNVDVINTGAVEAKGVTAAIKKASFGLASPSQFALLPAPGNPTAPATIPADGSVVTLSTGPWDVKNDPLMDEYRAACTTCIRYGFCSIIELNAIGSAQIVDKYRMFNLHLGRASKFENSATVNLKGVKDGGKDGHEVYLYVSTAEDMVKKSALGQGIAKEAKKKGEEKGHNKKALIKRNNRLDLEEVTRRYFSDMLKEDKKDKKKKKSDVVSYYSQQVDGYAVTKGKIVINGKAYKVHESIASYENLVAHDGPGKKKKHSLKGATKVKGSKNLYKMKVPRGGKKKLHTTIEIED